MGKNKRCRRPKWAGDVDKKPMTEMEPAPPMPQQPQGPPPPEIAQMLIDQFHGYQFKKLLYAFGLKINEETLGYFWQGRVIWKCRHCRNRFGMVMKTMLHCPFCQRPLLDFAPIYPENQGRWFEEYLERQEEQLPDLEMFRPKPEFRPPLNAIETSS